MTRNRISTLLIGALALIALPAVSEAAPYEAKQWSVDKTDRISNETEYVLYNHRGGKIGYENRTFGVDLGWVNGGFFVFVRKTQEGRRDRQIRPLSTEANVALYNTKRNAYLKYYFRGDSKAELEWSDTPVYEWQIQDQSASGGRVYFALFNTVLKEYLVYQSKNYGINLGWLRHTRPRSLTVAMKAQQITQGRILYLANFGGQKKSGNLLSVQNASQTATLMFVKPGRSTNDCSDPRATVRIAPRAMVTADQMKILYGVATPLLPIKFLACITTPAPQSISVTYLNITYKLYN